MKIFLRFLVLTGAVMAVSSVIPNIHVANWKVCLLVGLIFGILNFIVKPIINLLTLPINLLTLGLFSVVVNALLFWAVTFIVPGFEITTFSAALFGSIIISLVDSLFRGVTK